MLEGLGDDAGEAGVDDSGRTAGLCATRTLPTRAEDMGVNVVEKWVVGSPTPLATRKTLPAREPPA
jgi:hypothetical protein